MCGCRNSATAQSDGGSGTQGVPVSAIILVGVVVAAAFIGLSRGSAASSRMKRRRY